MHIKRKPLDRPLSEKRLQANRRNALKASGPKSASGRAISSQNARKYTILPFEDASLPAELTAQYYGDYIPADRGERRLVDILIHCDRVRRTCGLLQAWIRANRVVDIRTRAAARVSASASKRLAEIEKILEAADCAYENAILQLESMRTKAA